MIDGSRTVEGSGRPSASAGLRLTEQGPDYGVGESMEGSKVGEDLVFIPWTRRIMWKDINNLR